MLIKPSIDHLLEKVDSKYTLVIAAAQRGRQIRDQENSRKNEEKFANVNSNELKEVSVALKEIELDKIECHYKTSQEQLEDILNEKVNEEMAMFGQTDIDEEEPQGEVPEINAVKEQPA